MPSRQQDKDRIIAAALTFLFVLALLLFLFFGGMKWERAELAVTSTPDIMEDEPTYYEPDLLELGEEDAITEDAPAPGITGEPVPSPEPKIRQAASQDPVTRPSSATVNSFRQESPVKADSALTEFQEAADALASKFNHLNGNKSSKGGVSGSGGDGMGISGSVKGRSFLSCPKPQVTLRRRTVVTVNITINDEGVVTKASATGSADAEIRKKCEEAALRARWSAKKGAPPASGSITFTITPY